jgi:inner membrane protein
MIFLTHLAFALLVAVFYIKEIGINLHPVGFILAVLFASLIPDIDTATSFLGKRVKYLSHLLEHRRFFHSIIFMVMAAISAAYLGKNPELAVAALIGIASHLLLDSLTPAGLYLFWPSKLPVRGWFRTGGIFDMLLFAIFIAAIFYTLYLLDITTMSGLFQLITK